MKTRFDTLATARRLAHGDFTQVQSDALVHAINEAIDMAVSELATRDDFNRLVDKVERGQEKIAAETKLAIADNRTLIADTKASLIEAMQRQMIWTVATMIAIGGTIIAVIRLG